MPDKPDGSWKPKYMLTVRDFVTFRPGRARCFVCSTEWDVDFRYAPLDESLINLERTLKCPKCSNGTANHFVRSQNNFALIFNADGWVPPDIRRLPNNRPTLVSSQPDRPKLDETIALLEASGYTVVETRRVKQYDVRDLYRWAKGGSQLVTLIVPPNKAKA